MSKYTSSSCRVPAYDSNISLALAEYLIVVVAALQKQVYKPHGI